MDANANRLQPVIYTRIKAYSQSYWCIWCSESINGSQATHHKDKQIVETNKKKKQQW